MQKWNPHSFLSTVWHSVEGTPGSGATHLAPLWTSERPAPGALASAADMPLIATQSRRYPTEEWASGGIAGISDLGPMMTCQKEKLYPSYGLHDASAYTSISHKDLRYRCRRGSKQERSGTHLSYQCFLAACWLAHCHAPACNVPSDENRSQNADPDTGRSVGQVALTKEGKRWERDSPSVLCCRRTHSQGWDTETAQLTLR